MTQVYDVSFRAEPGFTDFTSATSGYHFYSVPVVAFGVSVADARHQLLVSPTPGFSNGASVEGTPNDATPVLGGLWPSATSPVMSFSVTNLLDHQPAVVNVTQQGHVLASGIVVREAVATPIGASLINTWGEGTSEWQVPGSFSGPKLNSVWNEEGSVDYKTPFSN